MKRPNPLSRLSVEQLYKLQLHEARGAHTLTTGVFDGRIITTAATQTGPGALNIAKSFTVDSRQHTCPQIVRISLPLPPSHMPSPSIETTEQESLFVLLVNPHNDSARVENALADVVAPTSRAISDRSANCICCTAEIAIEWRLIAAELIDPPLRIFSPVRFMAGERQAGLGVMTPRSVQIAAAHFRSTEN